MEENQSKNGNASISCQWQDGNESNQCEKVMGSGHDLIE